MYGARRMAALRHLLLKLVALAPRPVRLVLYDTLFARARAGQFNGCPKGTAPGGALAALNQAAPLGRAYVSRRRRAGRGPYLGPLRQGVAGSPTSARRGCSRGFQLFSELAPPAAMNASTLAGSIRRAPDTRTCRSRPRLQRAYTVAVETASRSAMSRTESRRAPRSQRPQPHLAANVQQKAW